MQDLTIDQLKFARSIGAVYCLNNYLKCTDGYFGKPGYVYRGGRWVEWRNDNGDTGKFDAVSEPGDRFRIDFTPLDELSNHNAKEQPLEWPVSEDLIGRKVRFDGYVTGFHNPWEFEVGELYVISKDSEDDIGPISNDGSVPSENYDNDFKFTLLPDDDQPVNEQPHPPQASNVSDGSTASYYELPNGSSELQDLISHRNMNAQDGEIFRAIYRKGLASHSDELRDAKKVLFYAKAEVARLEALKR